MRIRPLVLVVFFAVLLARLHAAPDDAPPRFDYIHEDTSPGGFRVDAVNNVLYVSWPRHHRVAKYSLSNLTELASVDVFDPGPMDLSPDGASLYVASLNHPIVYRMGLSDFTLRDRHHIPASLVSRRGSARLCALTDGRIFLLMGQQLMSFETSNGRFSMWGESISDLACSGNRARAVFVRFGKFQIYDATVSEITAARSLNSFSNFYLAMNHSGDRVAYWFMGPVSYLGGLMDENLAEVATLPSRPRIYAAVFTPDGQELALMQNPEDYTDQMVWVHHGRSGEWKREALFHFTSPRNDPMALPGFVAMDPTGRILRPVPKGVAIYDHSLPWDGSPSALLWGAVPHASGGAGSNVKIWRSQQAATLKNVWVGGSKLGNVSEGPAQMVGPVMGVPITATLPTAQGKVLTMVQAEYQGTRAALAAGFSEACSLEWVSPTVALPGQKLTLLGFGFNPPGENQVLIGGKPAPVTNLTSVAHLFPQAGMDFLQVTMPGDVASGLLDIQLTAGSRTCSKPRAISAVGRESFITTPTSYYQMVFDAARNRLYLASPSENVVRIFDANTYQMTGSFAVSTPGPMALSPNGEKLAVFNGQVRVIDLASGVVGPPTTVSDYPGGSYIFATPRNTFIYGSQEIDPATGTVVTLNYPGTANPLGTAVAGSPNGKRILFSTYNGAYFYDPMANTGTFLKPFNFGGQAISNDLNAHLLGSDILDAELTEAGSTELPFAIEDGPANGPRFNDSGSLLYKPTPLGVDIFDVARSRLIRRIYPSKPGAQGTRDLIALDATGRRIFYQSRDENYPNPVGITVIELNHLPLTAGHVKPRYVRTGVPTAITIRGSGFDEGVTAKLNGVTLPVTLVDESTLSASVNLSQPGIYGLMLTKPDGQSTTLSLALRAVESAPVLQAIQPEYTDLGNATFIDLTVYGKNFAPGHEIRWNGTSMETRYVSPGQMEAVIPGGLIPYPSTNAVTVWDPVQQISSNALSFSKPGPNLGLQAEPKSFRFSPQIIRGGPPPKNQQTLTLLNRTAGSGITITGLQVTGPFSATTSNCITDLNWLYQCQATVGFRPETLGLITGELRVLGPSNQVWASIPLEGTGADLTLNVSRPGRPGRHITGSVAQVQEFAISVGATQPGVEAALKVECVASRELSCVTDTAEYRLGERSAPLRVRVAQRRSRRLRNADGAPMAFVRFMTGSFERIVHLPLR